MKTILAQHPRNKRLLRLFTDELLNLLVALAGQGRRRMVQLSALWLRVVAVAEQIALLWNCAWSGAERASTKLQRLTPPTRRRR